MNHTTRYTAQKIVRAIILLETHVYSQGEELPPFRYQAVEEPAGALLDPTVDDSEWEIIRPQSYWGGDNVNFVLRTTFTVPEPFDPEQPLALYLPLGDAGDFSHPEALVYIDGQGYAAVDRHHQEVLLTNAYTDGQTHQLILHGWTGSLHYREGNRLFMQACAVVQIHKPTREWLILARNALQTADLLDELNPVKSKLYNALDAAYQQLDLREPLAECFYESVTASLETLREGIAAAGRPLDVEIVAAGHAHIDVAWLWTLGETRRKAGRTFYNVLRLMEQFPNYHFTQSQPQLYDYVRQDYPELFEHIKAQVADGRWEAIGGMWLEADCNITGAESLARQFVLGRSFFREHFGPAAESPVLWLPDVFGYSWSLPQLIKLAGLDYFFTIKIGWNQVNKMPYDSFWWQGIDGTKVLTHFSTTPGRPRVEAAPTVLDLLGSATYNANLNAFTALGSWAGLKQKEAQSTMLMSYGYGDGGGGPTREMNENAQLLQQFPAVPQVKQGKVIDFFKQLDAESGQQLPTWNNELYLEIHRGTYTTQSHTKRHNRKTEFLLHDAEFLAAWAALQSDDFVYPHDSLRQAWQLLCLNQFHDIIPGSSIHEVYVESAAQYAQMRELATAVRDEALAVLTAQVGGDVVLVNPTGFARQDLALWPEQLPEGQRLAGEVYTQTVSNGTLIAAGNIEPFSIRPLTLTDGVPAQPDFNQFPLQATPTLLENAFLRVELNAAGDITRIYDKSAAREVLPEGAIANQWQAFEDRPLNWDAWDIDIFYEDKQYLAEAADEVTVVENGPLRATLEIKRRILNSHFTQRIALAYNSSQLTFDTAIDWRERHILLKTAFPVDVLAPAATYEIQWGNVQRPTHRNTSWDWARFETAAQKWVDLSEGGYGVALLNDCKYGHDIHGNVIRLSLLRAPTYPDPEADQGEHQFAYSLYPHVNANGGALVPSAVAEVAYPFNDPLLAVTGAEDAPTTEQASLIKAPANIVVETVKQAEDGRGLIVRFYECNRQRGRVILETAFPMQAAYLCNLLEEEEEEVTADGQQVNLYVKPFQIVTLRLVPQS